MITINKATILLSFYIIGSTLAVYVASKEFLYAIVLNVIYLLVWVIAAYWFKLFQERKKTTNENKTKTLICPMCNGKGWIEDEKQNETIE